MILEATVARIPLPITARHLIDALAEVEALQDYNWERTFVRQVDDYLLVFESIDTLNRKDSNLFNS